MNPPFSADEKHILHAFEIAPDGCEIISLCNHETIGNLFSKSRKILSQLIKDYGEYDNLGDVFTDADRTTGIDIGLIRLKKPESMNETDYSEFFSDEDDDPELHENGLIPYNAVRDIVQRYVGALKLYDEILENAIKMNNIISHVHSKDLVFTCTRDGVEVQREQFRKELQKKSWMWIFGKMNLNKISTKGLKDDINKFVEEQIHVKFTMKNIYRLIDAVIQTTSQRMDKALIEVFDKLTKYTHENRYQLDGWKTNSVYLVNEKFIIPRILPADKWGSQQINYHYAEELDDLCKALCYITGKNYDKMIPLNQRVRCEVFVNENGDHYVPPYFYNSQQRENYITKNNISEFHEIPQYGEWISWNFFEVKFFKKGTGHFKFKDRDVWAKFNAEIARIKGYPLPDLTNEYVKPKRKSTKLKSA